jgi:hypothetical protein
MRNENVPSPPSPERPPLAPYDPPEPAPQAAAWRRALRVIGCDSSDYGPCGHLRMNGGSHLKFHGVVVRRQTFRA